MFFGFSPALGLHTILGIGFAFALNLNRVAVLLGVYSNLPWIVVPYYTLTTRMSAAILEIDVPLASSRGSSRPSKTAPGLTSALPREP